MAKITTVQPHLSADNVNKNVIFINIAYITPSIGVILKCSKQNSFYIEQY